MNKATLEFGHKVAKDLETAVTGRFPWYDYKAALYEDWCEDGTIYIDHQLPFYFVDKCNEDSFSVEVENGFYPILVQTCCQYAKSRGRRWVDSPDDWSKVLPHTFPWYAELTRIDDAMRLHYGN